MRGELETEQRLQHIDPLTNSSGYNSISFPFSWAAQLGSLGAQPLLGHGSHSSIFSPTDLNFLSPGLYNNLTSTYFLRASNLFSIQPIDSQGYPLISSTGCTSYLHRCISHLTAWPGRRLICNTTLSNLHSFWRASQRYNMIYAIDEYIFVQDICRVYPLQMDSPSCDVYLLSSLLRSLGAVSVSRHQER